jgi:MFS family permease
MDNANRFFQYRFCFTQVDSGRAIMYIYLSAVISSIPLGYVVDKWGKRGYFFMATMLTFFLTHLLFLFLPNCSGNQ